MYWPEARKYNTAHSFFKNALEASEVTLEKGFRLEAVSASTASPQEAATKKQETETSGVGGGRPSALVDRRTSTVELSGLAVPASSSTPISSSTSAGFVKVASSAVPCEGVSPGAAADLSTTDWLDVKCLELRRGARLCPKVQAANALEMGALLGEGTFGQVHKGFQKSTGLVVAVKSLKEDDVKEYLREVSVCSKLRHANVVRLLDVIVNPKLCLVFEYAGPTLHEALHRGLLGGISWEIPARQLLSALSFIHRNLVIHTGIKPKNLCWEPSRQHLTVLDLGNAMICLPGFRSMRKTQTFF